MSKAIWLSIFSLFTIASSFNTTSLIIGIESPSIQIDNFTEEFSNGAMVFFPKFLNKNYLQKGFLSIEEGYGFLSELCNKFPQWIFNETIGNTFEGQNMTIYGLTSMRDFLLFDRF